MRKRAPYKTAVLALTLRGENLKPRPMKLLEFGPKDGAATGANDPELFELCFVGLHAPDIRLVPAEMRAHGKLLDKFEEHGEIHEAKGRVLKEGETARIPIEDTELAVIQKCCQGFPWNLAKSRKVSALYELLEKAPEFRPEVPAKPADAGAAASA